MKPQMKARPAFWLLLLFVIFMVPAMQPFGVLLAQTGANTTVPMSAQPNATTQLIPLGTTSNPYGVSSIFYAVSGGSGTTPGQFSFMTGTVNNEATPCTTGRAMISGAFPVGFTASITGVANPNPTGSMQGNPLMALPGNTVMCVMFTGTAGVALSGMVTYNTH